VGTPVRSLSFPLTSGTGFRSGPEGRSTVSFATKYPRRHWPAGQWCKRCGQVVPSGHRAADADRDRARYDRHRIPLPVPSGTIPTTTHVRGGKPATGWGTSPAAPCRPSWPSAALLSERTSVAGSPPSARPTALAGERRAFGTVAPQGSRNDLQDGWCDATRMPTEVVDHPPRGYVVQRIAAASRPFRRGAGNAPAHRGIAPGEACVSTSGAGGSSRLLPHRCRPTSRPTRPIPMARTSPGLVPRLGCRPLAKELLRCLNRFPVEFLD
jgi:hypothetical protein